MLAAVAGDLTAVILETKLDQTLPWFFKHNSAGGTAVGHADTCVNAVVPPDSQLSIRCRRRCELPPRCPEQGSAPHRIALARHATDRECCGFLSEYLIESKARLAALSQAKLGPRRMANNIRENYLKQTICGCRVVEGHVPHYPVVSRSIAQYPNRLIFSFLD